MKAVPFKLSLIAGGILLAHAGPGYTEDQLVLEEVVVTATKRQESLMDVGVSVIAVDASQLDREARRGLEDVSELVPNVVLERQGGANSQRLAVRGISSPPLDDVESSVAVFIDGVYNPKSRSAFVPLYDMERVEVLRGPQGALFGKNSIAGVLNMVTAKPSQAFEAIVDLRAGNRNSHEAMVALSGGLTDTLAARFTAFDRRTGNWLKNNIGPDAGGMDTEAYRLNLAWNPGDRTEVSLKFEHFNDTFNSGTEQLISVDPADAPLFGPVDTRLNDRMEQNTASAFGADFNIDPKSTLTNSADLVALGLDHVFANGHEFSALYGYSDHALKVRGNTQNTPLLGIYLNSTTEYETHNLELRWSSPQDRRFHYTLGAYIEDSETDRTQGNSLLNFENIAPILNGVLTNEGVPPVLLADLSSLAQATLFVQPAEYIATMDSIALFAEGTFEIDSHWSVTAGLRYARDELEVEKSFDSFDANGFVYTSPESFGAVVPVPGFELQPGFTVEDFYSVVAQSIFGTFMALPGTPAEKLDRNDEVILPSAKIEFQPNDQSLYYFSAQTGYKNGGFNSSTLTASTEFEEETSLSFELGGKLTLLGGRGRLNLAAFYTEFDDLQVAVIDPVSGTVTFTNAAEATSWGIEIDSQWLLSKGLTMSLAYGYLNAEYDKFENAGCSVSQRLALPAGTPCAQDLSGETLNFSPEHSASLALDYQTPIWNQLEFQSNLTLSYTDEYFAEQSNSDELKAESSTLLHGRVALHDPNQQWTLALIVRNITNERDQLRGQTGSNRGTGTLFGTIRPPRSAWVQVEKRF